MVSLLKDLMVGYERISMLKHYKPEQAAAHTVKKSHVLAPRGVQIVAHLEDDTKRF